MSHGINFSTIDTDWKALDKYITKENNDIKNFQANLETLQNLKDITDFKPFSIDIDTPTPLSATVQGLTIVGVILVISASCFICYCCCPVKCCEMCTSVCSCCFKCLRFISKKAPINNRLINTSHTSMSTTPQNFEVRFNNQHQSLSGLYAETRFRSPPRIAAELYHSTPDSDMFSPSSPKDDITKEGAWRAIKKRFHVQLVTRIGDKTFIYDTYNNKVMEAGEEGQALEPTTSNIPEPPTQSIIHSYLQEILTRPPPVTERLRGKLVLRTNPLIYFDPVIRHFRHIYGNEIVPGYNTELNNGIAPTPFDISM
jgi:hypothetical protein